MFHTGDYLRAAATLPGPGQGLPELDDDELQADGSALLPGADAGSPSSAALQQAASNAAAASAAGASEGSGQQQADTQEGEGQKQVAIASDGQNAVQLRAQTTEAQEGMAAVEQEQKQRESVDAERHASAAPLLEE